METEIFNLTELIEFKWSMKIITEQFGEDQEKMVNDKLYQKVSYLCEVEREKMKSSMDTEQWKAYSKMIADIELSWKLQFEAAVRVKESIKMIAKINGTSFETWKENNKSF